MYLAYLVPTQCASILGLARSNLRLHSWTATKKALHLPISLLSSSRSYSTHVQVYLLPSPFDLPLLKRMLNHITVHVFSLRCVQSLDWNPSDNRLLIHGEIFLKIPTWMSFSIFPLCQPKINFSQIIRSMHWSPDQPIFGYVNCNTYSASQNY